MNDFVLPKLAGGLGNFLFQLSSAFSYGLKYNKKLFVDLRDIQEGHTPIAEYFKNIFRKIEFGYFQGQYQIYNEKNFNFNNIPFYKGNLKLNGYFQSEKYFNTFRQEILSLFEINKEFEDKINNFRYEYSKYETCSIHVRRGDYLKLQHHHPILDISYYEKCINEMNNNILYLIFSDDISWCETNFDFINQKVFIKNNSDLFDLYLMSSCNHNIIANSSFSWWASWLNKNQSKKIFAPINWFGPSYNHKLDDLFFSNTIIL